MSWIASIPTSVLLSAIGAGLLTVIIVAGVIIYVVNCHARLKILNVIDVDADGIDNDKSNNK